MPDDQPETPPQQPEQPSPAEPPAGQKPGEKTSDDAGDKGKPDEASTPAPPPADADREAAARSMQGNAAELSQTQMGEYVAQGINQFNAQTINVFSQGTGFDDEFDDRAGRRSGRRTGNRFTEREVDEATASFVDPPDFQYGLDLLADRSLLVLSGPARTGKRARALETLRRTLADAGLGEAIEELPGSALTNPSWRVPRKCTGYVVFDARGRRNTFTAARVNEEWLRNTADRLSEAESYLVVVTGPVGGSLDSAPNRAEFVLDSLELPDPLEIFQQRLRDTVPSDAEELIEWLAETELTELLVENGSPWFAVRAATEVVEGQRIGRTLTDTLAKISDPRELVKQWLSRDPEAAELSLVLSTAVLNDAGYLKVADAAVSLYKRLHGGGSTPMSLRYRQQLRAEDDWLRFTSADDGQRSMSVRFRQADVRLFVLTRLWSEYDGAREKVLEWLRELAMHTDVTIRAGAAQAIGILAVQDMEHGVHRFLQPWSREDSPALRQTAAHGLNVAGLLGKEDMAWSVLERWSEAAHWHNTENLCITAALAAGGPLGVKRPHEALRVLRNFVVCEDKWDVLSALAASARALCAEGCGDDVLRALRDWTEPGAEEDALDKALLVFTSVVRPETESGWPTVLRMADENRKHMSLLWSRAFGNKPTRPFGLDALRVWVRRTQRDPGCEEIVLGMLADITDESPADKSLVLHALRRWAEDRYEPSLAAATFYDLLYEAEEVKQ